MIIYKELFQDVVVVWMPYFCGIGDESLLVLVHEGVFFLGVGMPETCPWKA